MNLYEGGRLVAKDREGFRLAHPARQRLIAECIRTLPCPFIGLLEIEVWQRGLGSRLTQALQLGGSPGESRAKAFVIELSQTIPADLDQLRKEVHQLLHSLGSNAQRVVERDQWWFSAGVGKMTTQWFTTVHAGIYPSQHSRHWPLKWPVIVLVPAWIFNSSLPTGASADTRCEVRKAFAERELRYPRHGGAVASIEA